MDPRERRFRYYIVSEQQVMELLGNWYHHDHITLPIFSDLPEGYRVDTATYSIAHQAWLFRLYHPSFDPVEPTGEIPVMWQGPIKAVDLRTTTPI